MLLLHLRNNSDGTSAMLLLVLHSNNNGKSAMLLLALPTNSNRPSTMLLCKQVQADTNIMLQSLTVCLRFVCIKKAVHLYVAIAAVLKLACCILEHLLSIACLR